jgi:hypothetical protein
MKRIPREALPILAERYYAGESLDSLASPYDIAGSSLHVYLSQAKLLTKGRKRDGVSRNGNVEIAKEVFQQIADAYNAGEKLDAHALSVGLTTRALYNRLWRSKLIKKEECAPVEEAVSPRFKFNRPATHREPGEIVLPTYEPSTFIKAPELHQLMGSGRWRQA